MGLPNIANLAYAGQEESTKDSIRVEFYELELDSLYIHIVISGEGDIGNVYLFHGTQIQAGVLAKKLVGTIK
jgi:hypothetical protein